MDPFSFWFCFIIELQFLSKSTIAYCTDQILQLNKGRENWVQTNSTQIHPCLYNIFNLDGNHSMCDPGLLTPVSKCGLKLNMKISINLRWISVHIHVRTFLYYNVRMMMAWRQCWQSFYLQWFWCNQTLSICLVLDSLCFAYCRHKPITDIVLVWGSNVKYIRSFWENYYKKKFETFLCSSHVCIIIFSNANYLLIVIDDYPLVKLYLQRHIKVWWRVCLPFIPTPQCSEHIYIMVAIRYAVVGLKGNPCYQGSCNLVVESGPLP